jgi:hypothetical protein
MVDIEQLFRLYVKQFPTLDIKWSQRRTDWTKNSLQFFRHLAKEKKLTPWPDKCNHHHYLLDFCLEDKSTATWFELILEQEWHGPLAKGNKNKTIDNSKWWDFTKLAYVKAKFKIFIMYLPKNQYKEWKDIKNDWARWISKPGYGDKLKEEYLIIVFTRNIKKNEKGLLLEGYKLTKSRFIKIDCEFFADK